MDKRTMYIATVQIAVIANDNAEACDSISECLSANLRSSGAIFDWAYLAKDGVYIEPKNIGEVDLDNTEEGEVFIAATK